VRQTSALIQASLALLFLFVVGGFTIPGVPVGVQDATYNLARGVVLAFAGWKIGSLTPCRFQTILIFALVLSFFDHVFLKGGLSLVDGIIKGGSEYDAAIDVFVGVLVSYFLYAPIAMLMVYIGCKLVNRQYTQSSKESG